VEIVVLTLEVVEGAIMEVAAVVAKEVVVAPAIVVLLAHLQ